jgi:hypothetical protein
MKDKRRCLFVTTELASGPSVTLAGREDFSVGGKSPIIKSSANLLGNAHWPGVIN